jgi:hypothetical protein
MLHLLNLEEIEALLLRVPALTDRLEQRDPDYVPAVKSWLALAEDTLGNNRLPVAAEVATCRGALIAVERGDADGMPSSGRVGARKWREMRASHLLRQAADAVAEAIRSRRVQVDEASRIMMQLVAAADRLGLIPSDTGRDHSAYLRATMTALSERPELAGMVVHVTGLLGMSDFLIVLDRSITSVKQ